MRSARLTLALDQGALVLPPSGVIAVVRPGAEDDLSPLPAERVTVVTGFRPAHEAQAARGLTVARDLPPGMTAAILCLPRARDQARALLQALAAALPPGAPLAVDGQKTDGIEALWRDLRDLGMAPGAPLSKAHGKLFVLPAAPLPADWAAADRVVEGGFVTRPGVFSADGPDAGSALLAAALPAGLRGRVIDLGAGWGYLAARALATAPGITRLDLVEAEADALDCARRNVTDPRAVFHWADATRFRPDRPADHVLCNPPFHAGREADPTLGAAFIAAAAAMLAPDGTLWLVSNRHLPYEPVLTARFRTVDDLGGTSRFRLTRAHRPLRGPAGRA
ncbi:MAG: class I SAM-dependent methyltransferase [Rhodobacterales bacterium]|nr:class I SAM-dependent methyltransferase [Rhodobacterales bacterium]